MLILLCSLALTAQDNFADCSNAITACDMTTYTVESFIGSGVELGEVGTTSCYGKAFPESNSAWFQWTIKQGGSIAFALRPTEETDDLDFVLFKAGDQAGDCTNKQPIRCMASGINYGLSEKESAKCMGSTGLRSSAVDIEEEAGCFGDDDNFLQPLQGNIGETYYLFINNMTSDNGFTIEFSGSAKLEKPDKGCPDATISTDVIAVSTKPEQLGVGQAFPNPSSNETIYLNLESKINTVTNVAVFDYTGNTVLELPNYTVNQGIQTMEISTANFATGSYLIELRVNDEIFTRKFVIVKDKR